MRRPEIRGGRRVMLLARHPAPAQSSMRCGFTRACRRWLPCRRYRRSVPPRCFSAASTRPPFSAGLRSSGRRSTARPSGRPRPGPGSVNVTGSSSPIAASASASSVGSSCRAQDADVHFEPFTWESRSRWGLVRDGTAGPAVKNYPYGQCESRVRSRFGGVDDTGGLVVAAPAGRGVGGGVAHPRSLLRKQSRTPSALVISEPRRGRWRA
jgi:hypothetical protein